MKQTITNIANKKISTIKEILCGHRIISLCNTIQNDSMFYLNFLLFVVLSYFIVIYFNITIKKCTNFTNI